MYRVMLLDTARYFHGSNGEIYSFDKRPSMATLRDDYWQGIRQNSFQEAYSISAGSDKDEYKAFFNDRRDNNVSEFMFRIHNAGDSMLADVMMDVNMIIVQVDWEIKRFELYYHNIEVVEAVGSEKKCSRYIDAFCYDVDKRKLYLTSDGIGNIVTVD